MSSTCNLHQQVDQTKVVETTLLMHASINFTTNETKQESFLYVSIQLL